MKLTYHQVYKVEIRSSADGAATPSSSVPEVVCLLHRAPTHSLLACLDTRMIKLGSTTNKRNCLIVSLMAVLAEKMREVRLIVLCVLFTHYR